VNALVEYAREKGGAEWLEPLWTVADKAVTPQEPKETQEPPEPKAPKRALIARRTRPPTCGRSETVSARRAP
jgi:hypothetical protein